MIDQLPPVPASLRRMLKEYPVHIDRLQEVLDAVAREPAGATPHFDLAIWALEARLDSFLIEARDELAAARASGDAERVVRAVNIERLMSQAARKHVWHTDGALWDYFGK